MLTNVLMGSIDNQPLYYAPVHTNIINSNQLSISPNHNTTKPLSISYNHSHSSSNHPHPSLPTIWMASIKSKTKDNTDQTTTNKQTFTPKLTAWFW